MTDPINRGHGLLATSRYLPRLRLDRAAIFAQHQWMAPGLKALARGMRAMASWDEDSVTMAVEAGWFSSRWLMIKLVLVFGLSALHGVQSGVLRRMARSANRSPPAHLLYAAPAILVAIAAIAILAVVKPF